MIDIIHGTNEAEIAAYHDARKIVFAELLVEAEKEQRAAETSNNSANVNGVRRKLRSLGPFISGAAQTPDDQIESAASALSFTTKYLEELALAKNLHYRGLGGGTIFSMQGFLPDGTGIIMSQDWEVRDPSGRGQCVTEYLIKPLGEKLRAMTGAERDRYSRLKSHAENITRLAKKRAGLR